MPKKTKREKILAKERHRLRLLQELQLQQIPHSRESSSIKQTIPEKTQVAQSPMPETGEEKSFRQYFLEDFKKSLLLIGFVIALEIAVYFGTINNYFKF